MSINFVKMMNLVKTIRIERIKFDSIVWLTIKVYEEDKNSFKISCGSNEDSKVIEEQLVLFLLECLKITIDSEQLNCEIFKGFQTLRKFNLATMIFVDRKQNNTSIFNRFYNYIKRF